MVGAFSNRHFSLEAKEAKKANVIAIANQEQPSRVYLPRHPPAVVIQPLVWGIGVLSTRLLLHSLSSTRTKELSPCQVSGPPSPQSSHSPLAENSPSYTPPTRSPTILSTSTTFYQNNAPAATLHPNVASPISTTVASPTQSYGRQYATRLASLAARGGVSKTSLDPLLQMPPPPTFGSPAAATAVREKLMVIRRSQPDYKPPSSSSAGFLRKKSTKVPSKDEAQTATFKFKELSYLLDQEILDAANSDRDCAATVETLLGMGADANIYKRAKDTFVSKMHLGKSDANVEIPARYIQNAAERGKASVVWVLASRGASQANLNEAYHIAMTRTNLAVVRILLEHGADPNAYQKDFETFLLSGNLDVVKLVLLSPNPIAKECLSRCLKSAVESSFIELVELLVANGADLEYNHAEALTVAVNMGRWDILLRMVLNQTAPSGEISQTYLLAAVNTVMNGPFDAPLRFTLLEILLCAGAKGNDLSRALMQAVSEDDSNLIKLLIDFDVDVNYDQAIALRHAVSACKMSLVEMLLARPPLPEYLNMAFGEIPFTSQSEPTIKLLASLLLVAGASGDAVANLLVQAVRAGYNDLLQLLIDSGASIEYNNSEALVHAITSVDTWKVTALLKAPISPPYATIAFSAIDMVLDEAVLHELMGLLLARGARGEPVDRALLAAVRKNQWAMINLLLSNNASVGYANAASLVHAISKSDEAMMDTLLRNPIPSDVANMAFGHLNMDTRGLYPMAQKLISAGATGEPLSRLLISAVERQNITVVSLLIGGGASATYEDGASLKKAVQSGDEKLLAALLPNCTGADGQVAMEAAFPMVGRLSDPPRGPMISLFLQQGLRGAAISRALVEEAEKTPTSYGIVEMLVKRGDADLAAGDGAALKTAVRRANVRLVKILLGGQPNPSVVSAAFPLAMDVRSPSTRFDILESMLSAGATGDEVSIALVKTIRQQPEALGQIDLLLNNGADVNFGNGEVINAAFSSKQLGVLKKLVLSGATEQNLATVFNGALDHSDLEWQYKALEAILQGNLSGSVIDGALINQAQQDTRDTRVFSLLLEHNASVNYASGAAVLQAVSHGYVDKVQMLLQRNPSPGVIRDALQVAMEYREMNTKRELVGVILQKDPEADDISEALVRALEDKPPSRRLVTMLLDHGASVFYDDGKAIRLAAMGGHPQVLDILLKQHRQLSSELSMITTTLFDDAMTAGVWKTEEGLATMQNLLAHGASGMCVDKAFAVAAEEYESSPTAKRLVESLLQSPNANVNREDGLCLQIAAQNANVELVQLLLQGNPSKRSLSMAFPNIISSGADEPTLLALAKLFLGNGLETDLTFQHPSYGPVLFGTLTKYPNFVDFYQLLIDGGANLESQAKAKFLNVSENVTPLLWAMLQPNGEVETSVIKCFVENGANVDFKSEYSFTTPLMVAVQKQRRDVVFELLKAGASVSIEDQKGETALLKACKEGAYDIVELLLARSSSRNDGSIHEAATYGHARVVRLLISEGRHDPDFPSSRHKGRSALAQLALEADPVKNRERVKESVETLLENRADPSLRTDNRSPLFFGLDNKNPVEMTRLLLDAGLYRSLNAGFNMYKDANNTVYSPTMYVQKAMCQNKSPAVLEELYQLLKSYRGEDRFYIDDPSTPQPAGYLGIPEYLKNIEEERQVIQRKIDNERQLQLARMRMEKEEASERERIRNHEYQAELVRQADRKTREEARLAKVRADEIAHIRMVTEQKIRNEDIERNRQLSHVQRMHQEEQQHQAMMNAQELKMIEFKVAADRKRQLEIEDASRRDHTRQLDYLQQWKGNIDAQKQLTGSGSYGGPSAQKQLQWPYTKDDVPD
ncbi:Ankyrin-2 [Drechslerella dactyloides]|uniref:Ankyrin-2 n=1 Tax=Drechslerella dactyloides TaxID=74499 RepID=A0AAD6NIS3_DREDA|nr:Ankyrin-2 [Drechslerella dactyloides]